MCLMCYLPFLGALGLASLGGGGFLLRLRGWRRRGRLEQAECRCAHPSNPKPGAKACR